ERSGIDLIDLVVDSEEVIIVDSMYVSDRDLYREVFEASLESFAGNPIKTPHTLSLRDLVEIARLNNLDLPKRIRVICIGISDVTTLSEELSEYLKKRLDYLKRKISEFILGST
ncbi:MAG: hypothetical protein ABWJ42_01840, partial [Sulfolobales archaeon]